jgi:hypothetical protein
MTGILTVKNPFLSQVLFADREMELVKSPPTGIDWSNPVIKGDLPPFTLSDNISTFSGFGFPLYHRNITSVKAVRFGPVKLMEDRPFYVYIGSGSKINSGTPNFSFTLAGTVDKDYYEILFDNTIDLVETSGTNNWFYFYYTTKSLAAGAAGESGKLKYINKPGTLGADRVKGTPTLLRYTRYNETAFTGGLVASDDTFAMLDIKFV